MADDLKQTGEQDDARINPEQEHELKYWSQKLGVSREELRKAVQAAGPMVKDVQRHLGKMMWRDSPDPEALAREPARQVADETLQRIRPERWPSRFALAGGA